MRRVLSMNGTTMRDVLAAADGMCGGDAASRVRSFALSPHSARRPFRHADLGGVWVSFDGESLVVGSRHGISLGREARDAFAKMASLESADLSRADASGLLSAAGLFRGCRALRCAYMPLLASCRDASCMFSGCASLTRLSMPALPHVEDASRMFAGCRSLPMSSVPDVSPALSACHMADGACGIPYEDVCAVAGVREPCDGTGAMAVMRVMSTLGVAA